MRRFRPKRGDVRTVTVARRQRWVAAAAAVLGVLTLLLIQVSRNRRSDNSAAQRWTRQRLAEATSFSQSPSWPSNHQDMKQGGGTSDAFPDAMTATATAASVHELMSEQDLVREAMLVATRVAGRFPRDAYASDVLARAYLLQGDTEHAENCWNRCLELNADFLPPYHSLADVASAREDHGRVVALMQQVLRRDTSSVEARATLASSLMELGRFDEALVAAQELARLAPHSPAAWSLLGKACFQLEKNGEAKECYERALELGASDASALYGLGMACRRLGEHATSKRYLDQYRQAKSAGESSRPMGSQITSRPWITQELVWIQMAAGDILANYAELSEAERHWLRAVALDPVNVHCRQALAALYHERGNAREAQGIMQQIREIESRREGVPPR